MITPTTIWNVSSTPFVTAIDVCTHVTKYVVARRIWSTPGNVYDRQIYNIELAYFDYFLQITRIINCLLSKFERF